MLFINDQSSKQTFLEKRGEKEMQKKGNCKEKKAEKKRRISIEKMKKSS
jgi:hypothetical protein